VTKQFLVLTALKQAGYRIEDADIVTDKRKTRNKGDNEIMENVGGYVGYGYL
jgi:hypothetical protein